MSAGEQAMRGDPATVQRAGSNLTSRTLGSDVTSEIQSAEAALGAQSKSAIAVGRLRSLLERTASPAWFLGLADTQLGGVLQDYGSNIDDIRRRARQAQADLATAKCMVAISQSQLDSTTPSPENEDQVRGHRRAIGAAEDNASSATRRLAGLDEERRSLDASKAQKIREYQSSFASSLGSLPKPPRVSAGVSVSVKMPDGSSRRVSAVQLAQLTDPTEIRRVWDAMTPEQRQQLITDVPLLVGNLEGIPLRDRNTANIITAREYRAELEQQIAFLESSSKNAAKTGPFVDEIGRLRAEVRTVDAILGDRNEKYRKKDPQFGVYKIHDKDEIPVTVAGTTLVGFNPLRGSVVTYQGALDPVTGDVPTWVEHVGVGVPGTNSDIASFTELLERGKRLSAEAQSTGAVFTWLGAPMPGFDLAKGLVEPQARGFADTAAPRLASFVNSLNLASDTAVVPIAHSYGAAVLGLAESKGLRAGRIIYVAPAGLGHSVSGVHDFPHTKDKPHFSLQARNDVVVGTSQGFLSGAGVGHGYANPLSGPGITRLETGYLDKDNPDSGTIESTGMVEAHSAVFNKDSTSMANIGRAMRGDDATLYHENELIYAHGGVPIRVPDTGVAQPEEWVSTVTQPGGTQ